MITWMQRHKKYLIVTVWVSVIAFVAAGFIGWGAYDFNLTRSSSVAKVGERAISKQLFSHTYANYFNNYNTNNFNGELTQEQAREMGLENIVLDSLINKALFLNFADELGIMASNNDVVELITANNNFYDNGTFSKDVYRSILRQSGLKPTDYEEALKEDVILNKLYAIIMNFPVSEIDKEILGSTLFMEDRLSIATVTVNDNEIKIGEDEIKSYWDTSKDNFLTEKVYYLESVFIPLSKEKLSEDDIKAYYEETKYFYKDNEDRILDYIAAKKDVEKALRIENAKKDALKAYLSFKKGEITADKNITVKESSSEYNISLFDEISEGETLQPIQKDNGWEVLKLTSMDLPAPKTYEEAKPQVLNALKANKKIELLAQKSQDRLNFFKGSDLGFVTRDTGNITGLTPQQAEQFINNIFASKEKKGYVILGDKAYLYNIVEQKLPNSDKLEQNDLTLDNTMRRIREYEIQQKLINMLSKKYKIERYYKG
ncbi:MAG: SurA N-terminal domain-containing protein [Campylobacteraceae bacterium]|jgi:peptidyl-prolyl cis-trans isomerase D|nr:SurA N-terminal domain-containing protein [Campylobacteraceae bacterium]